MRIIKVAFISLVFTIISLWSTLPVLACTGCQVCNERVTVCDEQGLNCRDEYQYVVGDGCGQDNGGCASGYYMPPNSLTCRPIGTSGGSGNAGPGCVDRSVNCAPGSTISLNQPVFVDCFFQWGGQYCSGPGTAQRTTGCCSNLSGGECVSNHEYTTYNCCPAGTTDTRHEGSTYTRTNSCWTPTICSDANDVYVSSTQSASAGLCYVGCGEYNPNTGNCRVGESYNVYNAITTCRTVTYSCDATCNATAPGAISVTAGSLATTADVSWTIGSGGVAQKMYVGTNQAAVNGGCVDTANPCLSGYAPKTLLSGTTSESVTGLNPNTTYYFRVTTYTGPSCNLGSTSSAYLTPPSAGVISGTVYLDTFNTCSTASPTMDGVSVVMDGVTTDVSGPAGAYSFSALLNSSHTLSAAIPTGYICSNGANCAGNPCEVSGIVSPFPSRDFFMTLNRSAWWQAEGASVYAGSTAGGTTISSSIPNSVGASSRYLVLPGDGGTPALVMRASGNDPSLGEGGANANSWSARASYKGKKMDYQYFASQMGVVKNQVSDWGGNGLNQQTADERDFWYMKPSAGPAIISSNWLVDSNDSYVVFVDGDLEIDATEITVQPGGFLALVVNGDITVGTGVDSLQGVFIASSDFITESDYVSGVSVDDPLVVEGTVVAWGTTSFARNLGTGNILTPAEKFSYRPDFLVNMPEKMKAFALEWTEVVAGTIEN